MLNTPTADLIVCPTPGCQGRAYVNRRQVAGLPPVYCPAEGAHMELPAAPRPWDGSLYQQQIVVNAMAERAVFAELRAQRAAATGEGRPGDMMPGPGMAPAPTPTPAVNAALANAALADAAAWALELRAPPPLPRPVFNAAPPAHQPPTTGPVKVVPGDPAALLRDGESIRDGTIYAVNGAPRAVINQAARLAACAACGSYESALVKGFCGRPVCAPCRSLGR